MDRREQRFKKRTAVSGTESISARASDAGDPGENEEPTAAQCLTLYAGGLPIREVAV